MKKIIPLAFIAFIFFAGCKKKCGSGTLLFKNMTTENIKVVVGSEVPSGCESVAPEATCTTTLPSEGDSVYYSATGLTSTKFTEGKVYIADCVTHTINIH